MLRTLVLLVFSIMLLGGPGHCQSHQEKIEASLLANTAPLDRSLASDPALWVISEADISYSGMTLSLAHTVQDQVRSTDVSIQVFRDNNCLYEIDESTNDYLIVDVINDSTPFGDGSGTRTMTVRYAINPRNVRDSRIVSYVDSNTIISFCTRFNLEDPDEPGVVANYKDTFISARADITDALEILDLIEDESGNFAVEAFECDEDNVEITNPTPKAQGDSIRICVQPDAATQEYSVAMKSINSITLTRGDVSQKLIVPDGVIRDTQSTQSSCIPGTTTCFVQSVISNNFYYSQGNVTATGIAWIQFAATQNRQRRLKQAPIRLRSPRESRLETTTTMEDEQYHRKAFVAGQYIGDRDFSMTFQVDPSGTAWTAEAFLCSGRNVALTGSELARARNEDDAIRVCIAPSEEALSRGVYIRKISSFYFEQGDEIQFAVEPSGDQGDDSFFICTAGQTMCVIKTFLESRFFDEDIPVSGYGDILLQYGTDMEVTRRARVLWRDEGGRRLEDTIADSGYAGRSTVSVSFDIDPTYVPSSGKTWREKATEWWKENPLILRIVYVLVVVVAFFVILCFLWVLFCGNPLQRKTRPEKDNPDVVVKPVYVTKEKDEVDDDRDMPMDDEDPDVVTVDETNNATDTEYLEDGTVPPPAPTRTSSRSPRAGPKKGLSSRSSVSKSPKPRKSVNTGDEVKMSNASPRTERKSLTQKGELGSSTHSRKSIKSSKARRASKKPEDESLAGGSTHSRRSTLTSKSPKPRRSKRIDKDGMETSTHRTTSKSPRAGKPKKAVGDDLSGPSTHTTASKSPRAGRAKKTLGEGSSSPSSQTAASKSPRAGKPKQALGDDLSGPSTHTTASKSPRRGRPMKVAGDDLGSTSTHSVRSRRTQQNLESTGSSFKSSASATSRRRRRGVPGSEGTPLSTRSTRSAAAPLSGLPPAPMLD
eukprot:Nitzschia sp. Nitz4//scaffold31_size150131//120675//123552//NITZ4_002848-RA/size150131-augustus-gene-0.23-mRNA-1//-1//CDS//3329547719//58//frame0